MASAKFYFMSCIDPREGIRRGVRAVMQSFGMVDGNYDQVQVAGGAQDFDTLKRQLAISLEKHHVSTIVLSVHEDCAMSATVVHLREAGAIAKQMALRHMVEAQLHLIIIKLDGSFEEIRTS